MPNPTQYKVTDDVEREGNINVKGNEQDTASYEDGGKQSANGIKLTSSKKAEPESQGNIAEEANDKESTYTVSPPVGKIPSNCYQSRTENKHVVNGDSNIQEGMESEGSGVDQ